MDFLSNLNSIQQRIDAACARAGRDPNSVTLLAVSKGQPPEAIRAAADAGLSFVRRKQSAGSESENSACAQENCAGR